MKKAEFEDFVLTMAKAAREEMVESRGDFRQKVAMVDRFGTLHMIVIADGVLHGHAMANVLRAHSLSLGGADVIVIMADGRMKTMDEKEGRRVQEATKRDKWLIAEDPTAQEVLMVFGRSREHRAFCFSPYSRKPGPDGDIIAFEGDPGLAEAKPPGSSGFETDMIPDVWERVN